MLRTSVRRGLAMVVLAALSWGCATDGAGRGDAAAPAPAAATTPGAPAPGGGVRIRSATARKFMELDRLCWNIVLEWQRNEAGELNVTMLVHYDAGTLTGEGASASGRTAAAVIDQTLAEVRKNAKGGEGLIDDESQIMRLADALTVLNDNCWYLRIEKSGDWTVTAKELHGDDLVGTNYRAANASLLAAVTEVQRQVEAHR